MTPSSAVLSSVIVIAGTTMFRQQREGKLNFLEIVVFATLLLVALLLVALLLPGVAIVLAYLGMVGAFVVNGPTIFKTMGDWGRD